ncbi:hypothetical protein [Brevibacterium spongiae]|uniref:Uncharacterized protein n=1 Tax=Brevibacterium spongiae TaxID=2909672 RepID=A0ABY5SL48_9MICO|nr:hypothetical protein [Brevibacterium spongiae]UVI34895.1 hypothetical protein L1F31_12260 [Brevibacterium spongiae]
MSEQSSSSFWSFAKESWLVTVAGIVIGFLASCMVMAAWGVIVAWFGFIYLIAFTLALLVLLVVPMKSFGELWGMRRFWWFVAASVIAVVLTLIYSAVNGALFSGTPTRVVIEIQFFHSAIFFVVSVLVAAVHRSLQARKAAHTDRSRHEPSSS